MIKLVALDLDGTIVNDKLEISPRTLTLLRHLVRETEVKVVIATGRMFPSALSFAHSIGVTEPIVTYQGAMVRRIEADAPVMHHRPISVPLARKVLELLIQHEFHTNLYVGDTLITNHNNTHATYYARLAGVTPLYTDNLLDQLTGPATKIMAIDDHRVDELLGMFRESFPMQLNYCRSRSNFCEVIDAEASKWNALKLLADDWGILPEEVMAIGDQENDISMLTHAGVGVAMGNAPDHVKEIANYVTGRIEDDGAADAIEKFVFGGVPLKDFNKEKADASGRPGL